MGAKILFETHEDPMREVILFCRRETEILRGRGLDGGPVARTEEPRPRPSLLNPMFCFVVLFSTKPSFIHPYTGQIRQLGQCLRRSAVKPLKKDLQ